MEHALRPELRGHAADAGRLLLIDDDETYRAVFSRIGSTAGFEVACEATARTGLAAARRGGVDAVCLDLGLPDADGLTTLKELRALDPHLPVVILTGDSAIDSVVSAMSHGAYDYLVKSVDRTKLITTMKNAVERRRLETRVEELQQQSWSGARWGIVGDTPVMRALFAQIERVARSDVTVVVTGESGSGKELVARAIHDVGPRKSGPFVAINCAAIPESLQEVELFGHEKGAFTGAVTRRIGRLEQAHGGTLFLDEIAELSPSLQAKVLRCLQERRFARVGGSEEIAADFRLVTATHKDLAVEVAAGRFREDLYYRLVVFELRVPPLRERHEDIPLLAHHFLSRFSSGGGEPLRLAADALDVFFRAPWRGNIRELQNAIQHAAVVARGSVVRREDLPPRLLHSLPVAPTAPTPARGVPEEPPLTSAEGAALIDASPPPPDSAPRLPVMPLEELERLAILQAIDRHRGNLSAVIRELGLGRTTLYRKLQQYGIRARD